MLIIKILAVFAFLGSVGWAIATPDYESVIATVTSLSALVASFLYQKKRIASQIQKQSVSANGFGLQSGGDLSVRNISISKERDTNAR